MTAINNTIKKGLVPAVAGMFKHKAPTSPTVSKSPTTTPASPLPTPAKELHAPKTTPDVKTPPSKDALTSKKDAPSPSSHPSPVDADKLKPTVKVTDKEITPKPTANGVTPSASSGSSTAGEDKLEPHVIITEELLSDDLEAAIPTPPPEEASDLNRPGFTVMLVWAITIMFPLGFMVLGSVTAASKDKLWSSSFVQDLEQANKVALTAWPIFFAAIVAQSLRAFATYRVERGIRLRNLEQLLHSTSFASAVKQPFFLRHIDWLAIALVALWSLSPLASQAMQRMKTPQAGWEPVDVNIFYLDTTVGNGAFNSSAVQSNLYNLRDSIDAVFTGATIPRGAQDIFYMDAWRYPIMPDIDQSKYWASKYRNETDPDQDAGWTNVNPAWNHGDLNVTYSSHAGVPYMPFWSFAMNKSIPSDDQQYDYGIGYEQWGGGNNSGNGTYNFTMSASYFTFVCDPVEVISNATKHDRFDDYVAANGTKVQQSYASSRGTFYLSITPPSADMNGTFTFASLILSNLTELGTTILTSTNQWATTSCSFQQRFIESWLECDVDAVNQYSSNADCSVEWIKEVPAPASLPPLVDFASGLVEAGTPSLYIGQDRNLNISTFVERYLMDPNLVLHNMQPVDLSSVDTDDLTARVRKLFNTYWQCGFAPMYQTGFRPEQDKIDKGLDQFWRGINHHNVTVKTTQGATYTDYAPVVWLDIPWLVTLFICSSILLLVGIAGIIWEYVTVAPDILGFANSLVRSSKRVKPPSMALGAAGRVKAMQNMRVQIQDIRPKDPKVGKIGLAKAHEDPKIRLKKKLKPNRLYE